MTPAQATALRDFRYTGRSFSFGLTLAVFLSVFGILFCRVLFASTPLELPLAAVWALAVAPCLPFFCALLTARMFSAERASGMIDIFFASPVSEYEMVAGKFGSSLALSVVATLVTLLVPAFVLPRCVGEVSVAFEVGQYVCPLLALLMQCAFWCALGTMISALCASVISAAAVSLLVCGILPWAAYYAALAWMPELRSQLAYPPMLQHVLDASAGLFPFGAFVGYPAGTAFFLFAASRLLAIERIR